MREETIKTYNDRLKRYGEKIAKYGVTPSGARKIYHEIRNEGVGLGYLKGVMCALKWKTHEDEFGKIIKELNEEINRVKETHINPFKKINWETLKEPTGTSVDDLIKGLYIFFPPRRLSDYAYMKYVNDIDDVEYDGRFNYFVSTSGEFIFQNYKTIGKFGVQHFKLTRKFVTFICQYISANGVEIGDALIKYKKGTTDFTKRNLSRKLEKLFGTSVDGLRHSYITHLYRDPKKLFNIKKTSEMMGHNVETHLTYLDKNNIA